MGIEYLSEYWKYAKEEVERHYGNDLTKIKFWRNQIITRIIESEEPFKHDEIIIFEKCLLPKKNTEKYFKLKKLIHKSDEFREILSSMSNLNAEGNESPINTQLDNKCRTLTRYFGLNPLKKSDNDRIELIIWLLRFDKLKSYEEWIRSNNRETLNREQQNYLPSIDINNYIHFTSSRATITQSHLIYKGGIEFLINSPHLNLFLDINKFYERDYLNRHSNLCEEAKMVSTSTNHVIKQPYRGSVIIITDDNLSDKKDYYDLLKLRCELNSCQVAIFDHVRYLDLLRSVDPNTKVWLLTNMGLPKNWSKYTPTRYGDDLITFQFEYNKSFSTIKHQTSLKVNSFHIVLSNTVNESQTINTEILELLNNQLASNVQSRRAKLEVVKNKDLESFFKFFIERIYETKNISEEIHKNIEDFYFHSNLTINSNFFKDHSTEKQLNFPLVKEIHSKV